MYWPRVLIWTFFCSWTHPEYFPRHAGVHSGAKIDSIFISLLCRTILHATLNMFLSIEQRNVGIVAILYQVLPFIHINFSNVSGLIEHLGVKETDFVKQIHHFKAGDWTTIKSICLVYELTPLKSPVSTVGCRLLWKSNGISIDDWLRSPAA